MWKNELLVWEDTPDSLWNTFGEITPNEFNDDNDLYAKGIVLWRKITLGDFIERAVDFLEVGRDFLEDRNIVTSSMLTISIINFLPLHIEIIKNDDVANEFLKLIKREESKHYILKNDFELSQFSDNESLKLLISKLVKKGVFEETSDRYNINGGVLKSIHFWESNE